MKNRQILFTVSYTVKVTEEEFHPVLTGDQVLVRTEYTAISAGTGRDNLKNGPICTVLLWMPIQSVAPWPWPSARITPWIQQKRAF